VQVVSCNTHNISVLLKTLASHKGTTSLEAGRFVCMRRANDVSDTNAFIAAPQAGKHDDPSTLTVPKPRKIVGFCYTPQDGNSLLSSIAATLRYLDASKLEENLDVLRPYIFREI
jgi:hypothetical protein